MLTQDNQVIYNPGPVSPPRMDLTFEDQIPVAFSPITDQESNSTDEEDEQHFETNYGFNQSREYVEPSLPDHLLIHPSNSQTQQEEYDEPYFEESKFNIYQTSTLNGMQLSQQDDENSNSDNSYAALDMSLDDVSDSENSILKREEGEISPTPPRKMPKKKKKQKIPKRLKKTYPIMYSEVMASNFLYHTTKYIKLPVSLPKVSGLPSFHSLPNVKLSMDRHFLTAFSQTAALSSSNSDTSQNHKATPVLHYNYLCKIHRVAKALCAKKSSLQIFFAHLSSSSLPADLNSKKIERPLDVSNSEMWQRGPPEYFELGPPSNWFMRVTNEEVEWKTSKDFD